MKLQFKYVVIVLSVIVAIYGFPSSGKAQSLREQAAENAKLFSVNRDSAFASLDELIERAAAENDTVIELTLLERKCRYYYLNNQPDNLIHTSEQLNDKALLYHDLYGQGMANVYMAEAYSINHLYDKAIASLDHAYRILAKDKTKSKKIFLARANVLNSFANVYLDKGEPGKAVAKLKQSIKNYEVLGDLSDIVQYQYLNYSNIAAAYVMFNLDSAEFYAMRSMDLEPAKNEDDKIMLMNYYVLGKVNMEKENYQTAAAFYHNAMRISLKTGDQLNLRGIYSDLTELYNKIGKTDSAIIYDNKLKEMEISNLQRKYSSLQMIIDKVGQRNELNKTRLWIYITIGVVGLILVLLIIFFVRRKNSQQPESTPQDTYNSLIELVKKNDPGFMFAFEQAYPDFSSYLLKINPQLSKSEIEFCALLKLNLSTKEIAKYKFIEPRTVQNKKYRIRKRLNISGSTDIYNWVSSIQ